MTIDNLQVDIYQGSDENMSGKIQVANLSFERICLLRVIGKGRDAKQAEFFSFGFS